MKSPGSLFLLVCVVLVFFACDKQRNTHSQVIIHELSEPDMLNPLNYMSGEAGYMNMNIFPGLLSIDFKTLELIPVLANSRPEIKNRTDKKGLLITYTIRAEATFDNGDPVTAKDVEFSVKAVKNPKVNCQRLRSLYEFIDDIILYKDDPKKLTFVSNDVYILAEAQTGDVIPLPQYIYDPRGLMKNFTIRQLNDSADLHSNDPRIIEFAENFNSEKYQRDSAFVQGLGPYSLSEWVTGQRVVLKRKNKWWGENVKDKNSYFEAYPEKIIYQIINDQTTALVALKSGDIDVMRGIKSKDFVALNQSEKIKNKFNLLSPMVLQYSYLGINTRLPKFEDKRVRQALAHLVDVPKIIKTVFYDLAERVVTPVHPSKVDSYNKEIAAYDYNPEKSKTLLLESGWKDSNGDGTIDKMINGKREEFEINFTYNAGNDERKAVALMFQEEARKVGIKVHVIAQERSVYGQNQKNHNFEMYYGAWAAPPIPDDFKQVFHTTSYNGGSNYVGFGNTQSDAVIDSIRLELNELKRNEMSKRFQRMLFDETSYIFLQTPKERIAINKKFTNADATIMRPGYRETQFIELAN